jgi:hypothetical protein
VVAACEQEGIVLHLLFKDVVDVTRNAKNGRGLVFILATIVVHCSQAM